MKVILPVMLIFLITSCWKDKNPLFDGINCSSNCFVLTGKLIDSASNSGIAGGEIKFYFANTSGVFTNRRNFLGSAVTDANGIYSFKFDGGRFSNVRGYYVADAYKNDMFADPLYEHRVAVFYLDSSKYNQPYIQDLPLFHPATIKVRVVATTVTNFQYLTVSYSFGMSGSGIVFNGSRNIDTTIIWKTAGNLRTFIQADAVGNGVNIQKRDTIFIPINGSRQVEIKL